MRPGGECESQVESKQISNYLMTFVAFEAYHLLLIALDLERRSLSTSPWVGMGYRWVKENPNCRPEVSVQKRISQVAEKRLSESHRPLDDYYWTVLKVHRLRTDGQQKHYRPHPSDQKKRDKKISKSYVVWCLYHTWKHRRIGILSLSLSLSLFLSLSKT